MLAVNDDKLKITENHTGFKFGDGKKIQMFKIGNIY